MQLIDRWDNRAAAFFAAFSFMITTLGTNVSANTLSVGNDMTALAPRWINIRYELSCPFVEQCLTWITVGARFCV